MLSLSQTDLIFKFVPFQRLGVGCERPIMAGYNQGLFSSCHFQGEGGGNPNTTGHPSALTTGFYQYYLSESRV